MANITATISVDGWANLYNILKAAGYEGNPTVRVLIVINEGAVATYLHFTSDGSAAPSTAADGIAVSSAGSGTSFTAQNANLAGAWINTASATDITFVALGV